MLKLFLLGAILAAGIDADEHPSPIDDLLHTLALSRSDLAVSKDYLPDPERLPITKQVLQDPLRAELRVGNIALGLARADCVEAVRGAIALTQSEGDNREGLRGGENDYMAVFSSVAARVAPHSAKRELLDLVHPDSALGASAMDGLLLSGRSVKVGILLSVAGDLLEWAVGWIERPVGVETTFVTPFGRITIGSSGDDVYDEPHALIVDPGGNDIYLGCAGVSTDNCPVSVAIDLAGNDVYEAASAAGNRGVGILIDVTGDDRYDGAELTQGAGVGGIGILVDQEGDDSYVSTFGGQGFGLYGAGILIDQAGEDTYVSELLAQGAAGPGGVGVLVDRAGGDHYIAAGRYKDFRENGVYARSMSQGFSYGLQTEASGGLGFLVDLAGHDRYEASYFAQGASFWAGTGVLYDHSGDDAYTARRYAQGCGLHLSAGLLVDQSGNDVYSLWGVGQGTGHDLALGVLVDKTGNDRYQVSWMGQGVGSGNGRGILIDGAGDDMFRAEQSTAQGYGDVSRGFGSIGILLDAGGEDRFEDDTPGIVRSGHIGGRYDVDDGVRK
jgi:hypothetical protein